MSIYSYSKVRYSDLKQHESFNIVDKSRSILHFFIGLFLYVTSINKNYRAYYTVIGEKIAIPRGGTLRRISDNSTLLVGEVAALLHEIQHVKQHRLHKRYMLRYVFSKDFRASMEIEAYKVSIMAMYALGAKDDALYLSRALPSMLRTGYWLDNVDSNLFIDFYAKLAAPYTLEPKFQSMYETLLTYR